jgi:ATP-dependent 26S proteasome regulatory subunit
VVQFPFPDSARRREMWQRAFPAQTPKGQLDFDRLARLHINGGNIHNIALNAAFTAATRGQQLDMQTLLESARGEYVKIQKPIDLAIFKPTVREASA